MSVRKHSFCRWKNAFNSVILSILLSIIFNLISLLFHSCWVFYILKPFPCIFENISEYTTTIRVHILGTYPITISVDFCKNKQFWSICRQYRPCEFNAVVQRSCYLRIYFALHHINDLIEVHCVCVCCCLRTFYFPIFSNITQTHY